MKEIVSTKKSLKKIYYKNSNIHGFGLFAKRNIKKGETVFIIKGKMVNFVVKNIKDVFYGENWVGIRKNKWIDTSIPSVYLNHSCNPNCGISGSVTVVAIKKILKNEEVTIDYSIIEETDRWFMKCKCGYYKCRRKVRSIQFLPLKAYLNYLPYVPKYFQKVYNTTVKNKCINKN